MRDLIFDYIEMEGNKWRADIGNSTTIYMIPYKPPEDALLAGWEISIKEQDYTQVYKVDDIFEAIHRVRIETGRNPLFKAPEEIPENNKCC